MRRSSSGSRHGRFAVLPLLIIAGWGCGGDGDGDGTPDAAPGIDAPEVPACPKPKVFINGLLGGAETYTPGSDDSSTNRASILTASVTVGPPAAAKVAATVAQARQILEPLGIVVTADDPGITPHLEVVLVGSGWPFGPQYAANMSFDCGLQPSGVGMVNMELAWPFPGRGVSVAYIVGALAGLEPVNSVGNDPENCMSRQTPNTCAFYDQLALPMPVCGSPVQAQQAILRERLGCD